MRTLFVSLLTLTFLTTAMPAYAAGASCTTPWGAKVVLDGQTVSYEPYFTLGVYVGAIVVPMMRCSDGTWLQCDYLGNNCGPLGTAVPGPTLPARPSPSPIKDFGPKPTLPTPVPPILDTSTTFGTPRIPPPIFTFPTTTAYRPAPQQLRADPTIERARATIRRSIMLLDAAVTRAEGLLQRIVSRLSKLPAAHTVASGYVTTAGTELGIARSLLTELQSGIDVATGTSAADAFGRAKDAIHKVNDHLKLAMEALRKALESLQQ